MLIADFKTFVVDHPPPHYGGRYWVFVKLTTDTGIAGYGEAYIEAAANIQLDTCSPNFLIQESIRDWSGFHTEILKTPIQWEEGYIIPPTQPGIGVELDEQVAEQHPYDDSALHLEMLDRPVELTLGERPAFPNSQND